MKIVVSATINWATLWMTSFKETEIIDLNFLKGGKFGGW